jgi:hypothetical protein
MKRLSSLFCAVCVVALWALAWVVVPQALAAGCSYSEGSSVLENIADCSPEGSLDSGGDVSVSGMKNRIITIANNLIILGSLAAIGGIVYSSFLFIFSNGDDGQATTARMGIIYSLAGFAAMLLAFPAVNAVINLVFDLD